LRCGFQAKMAAVLLKAFNGRARNASVYFCAVNVFLLSSFVPHVLAQPEWIVNRLILLNVFHCLRRTHLPPFFPRSKLDLSPPKKTTGDVFRVITCTCIKRYVVNHATSSRPVLVSSRVIERSRRSLSLMYPLYRAYSNIC